jgi:hypothetical protein
MASKIWVSLLSCQGKAVWLIETGCQGNEMWPCHVLTKVRRAILKDGIASILKEVFAAGSRARIRDLVRRVLLGEELTLGALGGSGELNKKR